MSSNALSSNIESQNSSPHGNDDQILVRVENVSKIFCRDFKKSLLYGLKDSIKDLFSLGKKSEAGRLRVDSSIPSPIANLKSPCETSHVSSLTARSENYLRPGEFVAVKDVSFELRRGECLGLIGRNGAGKTTLLKMLNGLIKPDTGSITIRGRVGALIALGAGFNPLLTGRENIYVNGSVLGLRRDYIESKIEDIIDFAEIREFIDSPVQSYSSGMQVRLGFAIATAMDPDVLILDEVLAVGDAAFRHKCYHRINQIIKKCAVILVSHSMDQIGAVAQSVGMMSAGSFLYFPDPVEGIFAYNQAMCENVDSKPVDGGGVFEIYPPIVSAKVEILTPSVQYGESLEVALTIESTECLSELTFSFTAVNQNEQPVMNWNLSRCKKSVRLEKGKSQFRFTINPLLLHDGRYRWNLWIGRKGSIEACIYAMRAGEFTVISPYKPIGDIPYLPQPVDYEVTQLDLNSQA